MDAKQTRQGVLLALAAYFIWGIAPAGDDANLLI